MSTLIENYHLEEKVFELYLKGLSYKKIADHVKLVHGLNISKGSFFNYVKEHQKELADFKQKKVVDDTRLSIFKQDLNLMIDNLSSLDVCIEDADTFDRYIELMRSCIRDELSAYDVDLKKKEVGL